MAEAVFARALKAYATVSRERPATRYSYGDPQQRLDDAVNAIQRLQPAVRYDEALSFESERIAAQAVQCSRLFNDERHIEALYAAAFALAINSGNLRKANLPDLARRRCEILARYIEASPLTGAKTLSMMPQIRRLLEES